MTFFYTRSFTLLLGFLLFFSPVNFAQNFDWIYTTASTCKDVVIDAEGNVFVTGYFEGNGNFNSFSLNSMGGFDIFLAKFDANGRMIWVRQAGGKGMDMSLAIDLDKKGQVFITGYFEEKALFEDFELTSAGSKSIFIAMYDREGELAWVKHFGGKGNENLGTGLCVDNEGNLVVTGVFEGETKFGNDSFTSISGGNMFLSKLNPEGEIIWAREADALTGTGITKDLDGNIYLTGVYSGSVVFDQFKIEGGRQDIFLSKINKDGEFLWVSTISGNDSESSNQSRSIGVDLEGNVFITGFFHYYVSIGDFQISSTGEVDMFLAKFNNLGKLIWVKKFGSPYDVYGDVDARDLAVDAYGNVFLTGYFYEELLFENYLVMGRSLNIFIAKFNPDGVLDWAYTPKGNYSGMGESVSLDEEGNVYFTGDFSGKPVFGNTQINNSGGFVSKLPVQSESLEY